MKLPKLINLLFVVLFVSFGYAELLMRDPFSFGPCQKNSYKCQAIGELSINNTVQRFAFICINGKQFKVKTGDQIYDHEIVSIEKNYLVIRDNRAVEINICLEK